MYVEMNLEYYAVFVGEGEGACVVELYCQRTERSDTVIILLIVKPSPVNIETSMTCRLFLHMFP